MDDSAGTPIAGNLHTIISIKTDLPLLKTLLQQVVSACIIYPASRDSARQAEVREGLLLFTIFFNCSQTCAGVTELATPEAGPGVVSDVHGVNNMAEPW